MKVYTMNFSRYVRFKYLNTPLTIILTTTWKKALITSTKKSFDKIQYPVMIKNHQKTRNGGRLPQLDEEHLQDTDN